MRRRTPILVALALVPLVVSCVSQQHRAAVEAREAHAKCVSAASADHPECVALHERYLEKQRQYEAASRRSWGCDPAQEDCPTPR